MIRITERGTALDRMRERERERAEVAKPKPPEPVGEVIGGGAILQRTTQGYPIRFVGDEIIIDRPDGSQVIYCGREGRADAIRDGVLR